LQISPLVVDGFKNGFHQWIQRIFLVVVEAKKFFPKEFFCFRNLDALYRRVAGKPFVLEVLCLDMGTSVASALTVETIFSSFHELMQSRGVRRPSVCPSVHLSVNVAQIATSATEVAGSPPNLHTMVHRRARIQGVLKVKVKVEGHVIRALL